jgi:two-component system sensor histidine kinase/response regulator
VIQRISDLMLTPIQLEARLQLLPVAPHTVFSVAGDVESMLGYNTSLLLQGGVSILALVHPDDQDVLDAMLRIEPQSATQPQSHVSNLRMRQANGRIRCLVAEYDHQLTAAGAVLNLRLRDAKSLFDPTDALAANPGFRSMMESTNDFIFFKDRHHVLTSASQTLVSVTQPSTHWTDLIGQTDYDVFPEEYADIYYRLEKQVFAGMTVAHEIQEYQTLDGLKGWVDNRKYPIRNAQGEIIGLFGIARVITDQVRAEQALRLERDSTNTILATVEAMIVALDTEGRITLVNRKGCQILGYTEDELIGQDWFATCLPHGIDIDVVRDVFKMSLAGNLSGSEYFENPVRTRSGEARLIAWHNSAIRDKDGHIIGGLSAGEDITERKQKERELQQREQYQRALLDNFPFAVWLKDTESRFLAVNQGFVQLLGQSNANELIGKTDFDIWPAELAEGYRADDRAVLTSARKKSVEEEIVDANGARKWFETYKAPVFDDAGGVVGSVGFARDISERRAAAHTLKKISEALATSRDLLQQVIDTAPIRVFWKDRNCRYLGCNPLFAKDAGKSTPEEVIGKLDDDLHWADQADRYRADDRQVMESGQSKLNDEQPQTTPDGQLIYVRTSRVPLRVGQGEVSGVLGIYDDITERKHTEAQLRESEERFRALFEASRDAIYLHDGPTIVDCNQAALDLLGHSERSEIVGKTPDNRAAPDPLDPRDAELRAAERVNATLAGVPQQFEWLARKRDGTDVLLDVQLSRVDIGGRPHIQAIARDITERKKAEIALQEERHVRDTILESIPGISYAINTEGFFTFWNHNFQRATGRSADELQHCNAADLFEGEHRAHIIERIKQTFVQGKSDAEADLVSTDGQRTRYYFTGRRIEMGGQPILVGVGVDVGPLKAAEQNLRRLNEQLEERVRQNTADLKASYAKLRDTEFAMDSVGIGIHWVDFDSGRFIHANRFAAELLGYSQDELLQRTVSDIDPHFPPAAFREINDRIRQSGFLKFETEQIKRDGSYVPVDMTVYYHAGEGITPPRMISFMQDITDCKRAEQELLEAKATAEVATTAKSAFLANMSHEIRTPLNAITGMAHLIRKSGINAVQNDRLGKIEMAGAHLLEIINSILDLSKIEAGKFTLDDVALDVSAIVANVVSILSQQALAKKVDIAIDNQLSMNNFVGDPTRLQQGLLNFGSNAIKFSDKGRVTIHVKLLESDAETALLRFEVEDQGIGIEAATLPRLFSAFEQADNTTTRQYGGTGLGLAITKKLAQLMGGDAGATSELGHGSRFWFTARLRLGVQGGISQAPVPSLQAETILARDYADRKLLLVEDDLFNQEITLIILLEIWPVVDLAEDGLQAVERVKDNCYDLILMDMQMPRMDGLSATRHIRSLPYGFDVPVIAMTGNAFVEDRNRCYDAGMNDFLAKPVKPADLFEVILKWIRR